MIAHVDAVLAMMAAGVLDPTPLVSRHMPLDEAPEAYEAYADREALKIVLHAVGGVHDRHPARRALRRRRATSSHAAARTC